MTADIRVSTTTDAILLARLQAACFPEAWSIETLRRLLARGNYFALIANSDGTPLPAAFILVQLAAREAEVLSMGSTVRRRGFGRALLRAAAREACARGAGEMFLEVAEDNVPACALYASLGFVAKTRRRAYYRDEGGRAADAVVLHARLPLPC